MRKADEQDNIPLLRDSIALYLHTRQYEQAVAARHHLLTIRPQLRSSWLGLIVAHHLNGDPAEALEVFDAFEATAKSDGFTPQERAQLQLYIIRVAVDGGDLEDALRRLEGGLRNGHLHARGEVTQVKGGSESGKS
jgi:DNA-binding SARP family transcriptional activator